MAPRHVESSQTRDWTRDPCIGRQILNHWTTREAQFLALIQWAKGWQAEYWVLCVSHSVVSNSLWPHGLYSPPSSFVHGIFQARILEWVAISFSRGSSWPRYQTQVSCIAVRCFTVWATREALVSAKLSSAWILASYSPSPVSFAITVIAPASFTTYSF